MEWLNKMNCAIDYIEAHMDSKIDFKRAAQIACCSLSRFQRMFTFATDISLSEYVRCRRMVLSARELLNGNEKVIDIALKYGYESPAAFTRAFQTFHGIPPTSVRKLGIYSDYPRISLQITICGGSFCMNTKSMVRIEEHGHERVVNFFVDCSAPEEAAWTLMRKWCIANLNDFTARRFIGCAPKGHHPNGEEHVSGEAVGNHEYLAHMFLYEEEGNSNTFMGADVCNAPKGLFLVGDVALNEFNEDGTLDIGESIMKSSEVMTEFIKNTPDYEFDFATRPYYEEHVFTKEWFESGGDPTGFKLWLPIKSLK